MRQKLLTGIILTLVCTGLPMALSAQNNTYSELVGSAGGSFQGEDYMLMWSVGEVMIESYSQSSYNLFQGFHQMYDPGIIVDPENNLYLTDLIVGQGHDLCFSAQDSILVAGGGGGLIVESGGKLGLVAGKAVLLYDGFVVEPGGVFRAWIDASGAFCENHKSMLVTVENSDEYSLIPFVDAPDLSFIAFPNPSTGIFTIQWKAVETQVILEVFNSLGVLLLREVVATTNSYNLDLSSQKNGIYIIRYINGQDYSQRKLVKH